MTGEKILLRLQLLFKSVFDDESLVVKRNTSANDIEEWDSFAHMNLIVAVETDFGVAFSLAELRNVHNVGDLIVLIGEKTS